MKSVKYLALLRGINVGGKNVIKMADLKICFEEMRFSNVSTYIQSGNVMFQADESDKQKLERRIEKAMSQSFNYSSVAVVIPHFQLRQIVELAPQGFGSQPDQYKYDVAFLKAPLTPVNVLEQVSLKEGVDQAYAGKLAFYYSRLSSGAAQSRVNRIAALHIYQQMTIRNWNTTTKLLARMDET